MDVETNAAPSPAAEPTVSDDLHSFSEAEYSTWLQKGELPKREPAKAADSEPAQPSSEDESEEDSPESASAPEAEKSQEPTPKPKRSNAETRIKELLAENKRLKARAESRQSAETQKAEPSPAKPVETKPNVLEPPNKPKFDEFETYDAYEEARDKYYEDLADYKAAKKLSEYESTQAQKAQVQRLSDAVNQAKTRYTDFDEVFKPALQDVATAYQDMAPVVREMLDSSDVIADALYVLGSDQESMESFLAESKTNPAAAARRFALIERLVKDELAKGKGESAQRNEKGQFQPKVPEKKISQAPPPPVEVGGRGALPTDEVESAVKDDDFLAYQAAANRRDLQRRKG